MQLTTAVASRRSCNGDELQAPAGVDFCVLGPFFCCIRGAGPWGTCAPTGERQRRGRAANGDGDDDEVDAHGWVWGGPWRLPLLDPNAEGRQCGEGARSDGWESVHRTAWTVGPAHRRTSLPCTEGICQEMSAWHAGAHVLELLSLDSAGIWDI